MTTNTDKIRDVTILTKHQWTDNLFSFSVERPQDFRFTAGQFVRLGLTYTQTHSSGQGDEEAEIDVFRPYSIVSSPYAETLEFFSIIVPDGEFTSRLKSYDVGDSLKMDVTPFGFLTLARYQEPAPQDLWLLATGTGIAPFLSILQDFSVWQQYKRIILVYSVRYHAELAYLETIDQLSDQFDLDQQCQFDFVPIVTRENVTPLQERIPKLLLQEKLQQTVGCKLDADSSHVMLCGNPDMIVDTKSALKQLGLTMNRRGVGNIAVENYW